MAENQEKKHQKIGMAVTLAVHTVLFVLFFFMLAWREPDPPLPSYGIELNFGVDNTGSGETPRPRPTAVVERVEQEQIEEAEVQEVTKTLPSEVQEVAPAEVQTQPTPSPDVVEEVSATETEVVEETREEATEPQQPTRQPASQTTASNQGNESKEAGDQGDEEGEIDARAIYGAQGSSQGASLQMEGWNWDYIPRPDDTSDESGKIVFQITIDDQGEVIGVRTLEKTVSPAIERLYREAVERVTFSRTADNIRPAPTSTGRITFVIRTK